MVIGNTNREGQAMKHPITRDELVDIRRALCYLHDEIHHPGNARNDRQDVNELFDDALRRIDHALNS